MDSDISDRPLETSDVLVRFCSVLRKAAYRAGALVLGDT